MPSREEVVESGTRIVLRPLATPMPLGFLALMTSTATFAVVELGWIPSDQARAAAFVAVGLTAPLQLVASIMGFLARDPVAATGMAVLSGTWGVTGLSVLFAQLPGTTSPGLGVLLVCSACALLAPISVGYGKKVAAGVMGLTATRFAVSGAYQLTGSDTWKLAAGATGLLLAVAALYAALALEVESQNRRTILPLGRPASVAATVRGEGPFESQEVAAEPGVRPRL